MRTAYRRREDSKNSQFVKMTQICKAVPFYGYHVGWRLFVKVYFYNPSYVPKCADLLVNGHVLERTMQPCEAHIPYLLAFLADFNLSGCDWIALQDFSSRPENGFRKMSFSQLELDVDANAIINRYSLKEAPLHYSFASETSDHVGTKIESLRQLKRQDHERRVSLGVVQYSKTLASGTTYSSGIEWERQNELLAKMAERIRESEIDQSHKIYEPTLESFAGENSIPTIFETVGLSVKNLESLLSDENPEQTQTRSSQDFVSSAHTSQGSYTGKPHKRRRLLSGSLEEQLAIANRSFSKAELETSASQASEQLLSQYSHASKIVASRVAAKYDQQHDSLLLAALSPSSNVLETVAGITVPKKPFCGDQNDVPFFPLLYGGKEIKLKGNAVTDLRPFQLAEDMTFTPLYTFAFEDNCLQDELDTGFLQLAGAPPSYQEVKDWASCNLNNSAGPSVDEMPYIIPSLESIEPSDEMSILAVEVHVQTRRNMVPSAKVDPISAIFWHAFVPRLHHKSQRGILTVKETDSLNGCVVTVAQDERELLQKLKELIRKYDPDVLCGYETGTMSWGYISSRYQVIYNDKMDLGRINDENTLKELPFNATIAARGRHVLNLWTILRSEVTLLNYTLENVVQSAFHQPTPHLSFDALTEIWDQGGATEFYGLLNYYFQRLQFMLRLLAHFEIITKYSEQARIIGIDFLSTLTRGSQYKVEAVLCRMAKRESFIFLSPSKKQVSQQNALEYIPLVMEPKSGLYTDPVCVLDFRALYPSIVIAYNLCYSTCLGRVDLWRGKNKLGVLQDLQLPDGLLQSLKDKVYIAPNGIAYVQPSVRRSLLAQMLEEILGARFMIKDSMKLKKGDVRYHRKLNGQQLALKFIANVTYGYTSASFSGRMPCAELADSIVLSAREILVNSIKLIESTKKWGMIPEVVYGDTDSLFVRLPGVNRTQAFAIGTEIADMITASCPSPIMLELEKVYHPCFLLTKKRYVGNSYETPHVTRPKFDAKGTETVRRDGTPIEQKLEMRSLQILFETNNISQVKQYLRNQWRRIINGRIPVREFCFAQEVKLGSYSTTSTASLPGGAVVSLAKMAKDEGAGPQYRERVPFVVTAGPPGSRIADRCVSPEDFMLNRDLVIDSDYYILNNIIPPLERFFNLLGANVKEWYQTMPKPVRGFHANGNGETLRHYLKNTSCSVCLAKCDQPLCSNCQKNKPKALYVLLSRAHIAEKQVQETNLACTQCSGRLGKYCRSLDCPMFYERENAAAELVSVQAVNDRAMVDIELD